MFKSTINTISKISSVVKKGASDFKEGFKEGFAENYARHRSVSTSEIKNK